MRSTLVLTEVIGARLRDGRLASLGHPEAEARWAEHDAAVAALAGRLGGRVVERADGVLGLFGEVEAASEFARGYLAALGGAARVAVHHGALAVRESEPAHVARGAKAWTADGLALSVAARVRSVAAPGQVLWTSAARPGGVTTSHGWWRLKGAPEPIELFAEHGAPVEGPKAYPVFHDGEVWRPVRQVPNDLPAEGDPFVGREAELHELGERIERARLVTVTGPGGVGKTRLVLRYAHLHLGAHPDGVWWRDAPGDGPSADRGLWVLDTGRAGPAASNIATGVSKWQIASPEATIVVTAREPLGLPDEEVYTLPPMDAADAAALYEVRASATHRGFEATEPETIGALVEGLDHLPLAIELAAARVRVMPPRVMLARLGDRLRVLRNRQPRDRRHGSIESMLDPSWARLAPDERRVVIRLASLPGDFTPESAAAHLGVGPPEAREQIERLVARSWIQRHPTGLSLLGMVRAFAEARRAASSDAP